ncbi:MULTISPECIES: hypothetical protein [Psychrilyobacter]|uniref:Uncharacterized protein n=1 Tax=Psychrilyobacter piezotolerans TaxID=2293438 RepID=A0ABX9KJH4_9FUSO|nr:MULTISPECIES: hypothetical protein [Psychrilyobacter]MCS5421905.1 hypothetical protein [Psychrilyobacter sp. S5]NDI76941.1 hypothetical protein [Psychrilyobacter piezotolerans]RDE64564.1 hypothetical protein DV867_03215 [Psychrilyobacter sp. S5]REI42376.1 hypothetical protein DYH56_03215 [Psychrilyobacter piezotolerans]
MKIGADKIVHLLAGALISVVTLLLTGSGITAIIAATGAGIWKEWWDSKGHGKVEFADFLATAAGGVLAVGSVKLFGYIMDVLN